jgi:uncharacterized protein (DUF433 family)
MSRLTGRITMGPAICHGKTITRGLRYPVELILELLSGGMSRDDVLAGCEHLGREDVLAALTCATRLSSVKRIKLLAA